MYLCPDCRKDYPDTSRPCQNCNWQPKEVDGLTVFLSNSDMQDGFFKEYVENYHDMSVSDMDHSIVESTYLANQADKMISYIDVLPDEILEVGVGQGFLLRRLRTKYPDAGITAVDISIPFLKHVKSTVDIECMVANAENLPFRDQFDMVIASDILEHVINPIDFLLSANYSLNSGGTLVLRVPYEDNMLQYSKLLGCKYKFAHLRNFSRRNLILLLKQAGFEVTDIHYDGYYTYSRRTVFRKGKIGELFVKCMNRYFPDQHDVSKIPNWLGSLLMRPLEIVVAARKVRVVTSMNYPV